jgi:hypothetical protein
LYRLEAAASRAVKIAFAETWVAIIGTWHRAETPMAGSPPFSYLSLTVPEKAPSNLVVKLGQGRGIEMDKSRSTKCEGRIPA